MTTNKILCALVPTPDGERVLCRVLEYPIPIAHPPYKPLVRVRRIHGRPFGASHEALIEMDRVEFKFVEAQQ